MQQTYSFDQVKISTPTVLTIGKFNGMHLGHMYLLKQVVTRARQLDAHSAALTFDPHPTLVLQPQHQRVYLTPESECLHLIKAAEIQHLIVLPFNQELARWTAEEFMSRVCQHINLHELWVGPDFRLGHRAHGDIHVLRELGKRLRFSVHPVAPLEIDGAPVSATRIRELLHAGHVAEVPKLLGRSFVLQGPVVQGDQRGRTIGFPTANIAVGEHHVIPADGVYTCQVKLPNGSEQPAVTNIGVRPTFGTLTRTVEAHLLDWSGDLYGQVVQVAFLQRIRGERKFDGLAALQAQIEQDIIQARRHLDES
jgi:riboflavin kinase/FMN adenylyltransferase